MTEPDETTGSGLVARSQSDARTSTSGDPVVEPGEERARAVTPGDSVSEVSARLAWRLDGSTTGSRDSVVEPGDEGARAETPGTHETPETPETHDESGLDLARAIARGLAGRTGPQRRTRFPGDKRPTRASGASVSGAHPDERDPQTIDAMLGKLVTDRGWENNLRVHGVFSRWSAIVGDEVGQHVQPEAYADGRLTVRADSTAWATQMKLLAADVVRRLNEVLGDGTVLSLDIQGPHLPKWSRGRYRVKGRGERDTFG